MDGRRVVFDRRQEPRRHAASYEARFDYGPAREGELSVLTPEGVCVTGVRRTLRATQSCEGVEREWSGFELAGCAFPHAGPLVVFQGGEPLRVQALSELAPATGDDALAFKERARGHGLRTGMLANHFMSMRESAAMQREMEAMQARQAAIRRGLPPPPPPEPPPPRAPVQLGDARTAFGVWMIDAINSDGRTVMVTASWHTADFRIHLGNRWHTLVAGPRDSDYAYLIGTSRYSWPVVVPARHGTWPRPYRYDTPPFGLIGPVMCADAEP